MKITVTQDKELAEEIRKALRENDGYCPCSITKTPDSKCMCKDFLENIERGPCHCGLYIKIEE